MCCSPNIIDRRSLKADETGRARSTYGKDKTTTENSGRKNLKVKRQLGRHSRTWKDNIKVGTESGMKMCTRF